MSHSGAPTRTSIPPVPPLRGGKRRRTATPPSQLPGRVATRPDLHGGSASSGNSTSQADFSQPKWAKLHNRSPLARKLQALQYQTPAPPPQPESVATRYSCGRHASQSNLAVSCVQTHDITSSVLVPSLRACEYKGKVIKSLLTDDITLTSCTKDDGKVRDQTMTFRSSIWMTGAGKRYVKEIKAEFRRSGEVELELKFVVDASDNIVRYSLAGDRRRSSSPACQTGRQASKTGTTSSQPDCRDSSPPRKASRTSASAAGIAQLIPTTLEDGTPSVIGTVRFLYDQARTGDKYDPKIQHQSWRKGYQADLGVGESLLEIPGWKDMAKQIRRKLMEYIRKGTSPLHKDGTIDVRVDVECRGDVITRVVNHFLIID